MVRMSVSTRVEAKALLARWWLKLAYYFLSGTVLCYGQTGAGKTFTITGATENYKHRGMIPRAIQQVFSDIDNKPEHAISIRYFQVHPNLIPLSIFFFTLLCYCCQNIILGDLQRSDVRFAVNSSRDDGAGATKPTAGRRGSQWCVRQGIVVSSRSERRGSAQPAFWGLHDFKVASGWSCNSALWCVLVV